MNPLQFFGEKEIHYIFGEAIQDLLRSDPKWKGAKLMREVPTQDKYKRHEGALIKTDVGTKAFIDMIIKHEKLTVGFEFYFRKETRRTELDYGLRHYWLRQSSVRLKEAITHARNDWIKLSNQKSLDIGYMILFVAGFSYNEKDYQRFVDKKRKLILSELERLFKSGDERIRILYCERYCIGSLDGTTNRFHKQFG